MIVKKQIPAIYKGSIKEILYSPTKKILSIRYENNVVENYEKVPGYIFSHLKLFDNKEDFVIEFISKKYKKTLKGGNNGKNFSI